MKIAFAPVCACKNSRWIWRHNASTRDVPDHPWCRHIANSVKAVSSNGEVGDKYLLLVKLCIQDIKKSVRNKMIYSLPWITILGHLWGYLLMIFTRDFVTNQNYRQIASLVTQVSLFTVTHALFFISPHWHFLYLSLYWIRAQIERSKSVFYMKCHSLRSDSPAQRLLFRNYSSNVGTLVSATYKFGQMIF